MLLGSDIVHLHGNPIPGDCLAVIDGALLHQRTVTCCIRLLVALYCPNGISVCAHV